MISISAPGWSLPISGLDYWIRGLPRPQAEAAHRFDAEGLTRSIRQDGWDIEYRDYFSADDEAPPLPRRLTLMNETLTLKLAIERWQASTARAEDADLFPSFD